MPILAIEPHRVELVSQLARMQCPINVTTGLQLANSIVAGIQYESELVLWREKHCVFARRLTRGDGNNDKDDISAKKDSNLLGWGYRRNFMKHNGHLIKSKKVVKV